MAATLSNWFAILTGVALLGAFYGWYHSVNTYRDRLSERSYKLLRYAVPPLMFAVASPMVDLIIYQLGGGFPTIGFPGVVVGLVGSGGALGYVLFDLQGSTQVAEGEATEGD